MKRVSPLAIAAVLGFATVASAHVTIAPHDGKPNSETMMKIHVAHGCDGAPTSELRIELSGHLTMAHPQDVPGWTLTSTARGGHTRQVVWKVNGEAPAATPDFQIHIGLPRDLETLYFPVTQICGKTVVHWNQKAKSDDKVYEHPAPKFSVTLYPSTPPVLHLH